MTKKYITLAFKLREEKPDDYFLRVHILENKKYINIEVSKLCSYFEKNIKEMAKEYWPNKAIFINYNENIKLGFFNYREFMKRYYPLNQ